MKEHGSRSEVDGLRFAAAGRDFRPLLVLLAAILWAIGGPAARLLAGDEPRPNLILILTDDQRYDAMGCAGNPHIHTPNIDALAARGVRFTHALVTLSICSPSRAVCLTGRYGSATGVTYVGAPGPVLDANQTTFAILLKQSGYRTGYVGKWHLPSHTPGECGFEFAVWYSSNGPHYNRRVTDNGKPAVAAGFLEDYAADQAIRFIESSIADRKPFVLHFSTQVPHMTPKFDWEPRPETLRRYRLEEMPAPANWRDDLSGKPPYLATARNRTRAQEIYGYDKLERIQEHMRRYYAAITDMDASLGRLLEAVDQLGLREQTYVLFTSDNGWMLGDHGLTSKVLAYEPSIRVPLVLAGPGIAPGVCDELVGNVDVAPTLLDMAGAAIPANLHGRSLLPLVRKEAGKWRDAFFYEAPTPSLGSWPHLAVRTRQFKYIRTFDVDRREQVAFEELYDLRADPDEMKNVAAEPGCQGQLQQLRAKLEELRAELAP